MSHTLTKRADGYLLSKFVGDIDEAAIEAFKKAVEPYLAEATEATPLHFLADAAEEGTWEFGARREFTKYFDDKRLGHVAVINASRFTRVVSTFMVKATGRGDSVRFFEKEAEGVAWLNESTKKAA
jgi:hypothetical protein